MDIISKLKSNKLLLVLIVSCAIIVLLDISVLIFNIVQLIMINGNSAKISNSFLSFNIAIICINGVVLILTLGLLIFRKLKHKDIR